MTYLELCQRCLSMSNVELSKMIGQPLTVVGQAGDLRRIVDSVRDAWLEIQAKNTTWPFLWNRGGSIDVLAGAEYTPLPQDCVSPVQNTFRYVNAEGAISRLRWIDFDFFINQSIARNNTAPGAPVHVSVAPDNTIAVNPVPDATYTLLFDYYQKPQIFTADADTPALDERYQMAIVYLALMKFGEQIGRSDLIQIGSAEYEKYMTQISNDLLPKTTISQGYF